MPTVFISYRRADTSPFAGRLYDRLTARFGARNIFKDVDKLVAGSEFWDVIVEWVYETDVMLVLIGTDWRLDRLQQPGDFVRREISLGLGRQGCRVIPILVNGASMPIAGQLPPELQPLANLHALPLRDDPDFNRDVTRLIEHIARDTPLSSILAIRRYVDRRLNVWWVIGAIGLLLAVVVFVIGALLLATGDDAPASSVVPPETQAYLDYIGTRTAIVESWTDTPTITPNQPATYNAASTKIAQTAQSTSDQIFHPAVTIVEPLENARYTLGQTVSVVARATDSEGVALVELLVNGLRVDSQSFAEEPLTMVDVVLDYSANQSGEVVLMVRAYNFNNIPSDLAERRITVLSDSVSVTDAALTPTPYNPICRARIDAGGLRLRTGPGSNYDIITNLMGTEELLILGYVQRTDGLWWQLSWSGQVGWTFAAYTTQLGDCSLLQPATVPASPTPQVTSTSRPTATSIGNSALPDLMLSVLTGPREVTLGTGGMAQANYPIQVMNNGSQKSGTFRVGVVKPDGQTDYFDVPSLDPGATYNLEGTSGLLVTFTLEGVNRILVTVDPEGSVLESNENNNQAYLDVIVRGS